MWTGRVTEREAAQIKRITKKRKSTLSEEATNRFEEGLLFLIFIRLQHGFVRVISVAVIFSEYLFLLFLFVFYFSLFSFYLSSLSLCFFLSFFLSFFLHCAPVNRRFLSYPILNGGNAGQWNRIEEENEGEDEREREREREQKKKQKGKAEGKKRKRERGNKNRVKGGEEGEQQDTGRGGGGGGENQVKLGKKK